MIKRRAMNFPQIKINYLTITTYLATIGVFILLIKLGIWQLDRAEYKQRLEQELVKRQSITELGYKEVLALASNQAVTGYPVMLQATPINKLILLDNQVYQGQVGYLAYQVMKITEELPYLLVELGFVIAPKNRNQLPNIMPITKQLNLIGKVYQKQLNPLSSKLMAEPNWPKRIQNLNIPQLSQDIELSLSPFVFQPNNIPELPLPHPWQPIPLSSQKHFGYAVQWFGLAAAFLLLSLKLIRVNYLNKFQSIKN